MIVSVVFLLLLFVSHCFCFCELDAALNPEEQSYYQKVISNRLKENLNRLSIVQFYHLICSKSPNTFIFLGLCMLGQFEFHAGLFKFFPKQLSSKKIRPWCKICQVTHGVETAVSAGQSSRTDIHGVQAHRFDEGQRNHAVGI